MYVLAAAEINGRLLDETQENLDLEMSHINEKEHSPVPRNSIQSHPR